MSLHHQLDNDPTDSALKNLHLPGYSVADETARLAITTMAAGDLCYQQDTGAYFYYNGSNWLPIAGASISLTDKQIAYADADGNIVGAASLTYNAATQLLVVAGNASGIDGKSEVGAGYLHLYMYELQPFQQSFRANGTPDAPSNVLNGDILLRLSANGYGATGWSSASRARLNLVATENWTDSAQGSGGSLQATKNGSTTVEDLLTFDGEQVQAEKFFSLGAPTELTIASGEVTATRSYHQVDTESDAASDYLDTINGGADGRILILRAENASRVVTVTTAGNCMLAGGSDMVLNSLNDTLTLLYDAGQAKWLELSRSDNDNP